MDTSGLSGSMAAGSSGRKSASNAISVSFGDDHAMDNMRERIATRKKNKKQVADEATKSLSTKGNASKDTEKATTDEEGRKLTKCIDQALQFCTMSRVKTRRWQRLQ